MVVLISCLVFMYGTIVGSYLHVVGYRYEAEVIYKERSQCDHCFRTLRAIHLIPLFSFLYQKGKCTYCRAQIPIGHFYAELAGGILFVWCYITYGWSLQFAYILIFVVGLLLVSIIDLYYMIIPDKIIRFFLIVFIFIKVLFKTELILDGLIGATLGFLILLLIAFVSNGGMGGGDIKLMLLIGFVLGWKLTLLALFVAAVIGLLTGACMLLMKRTTKSQPFPFGPSLAIGSFLVFLYGETTLEWYMNIFF